MRYMMLIYSQENEAADARGYARCRRRPQYPHGRRAPSRHPLRGRPAPASSTATLVRVQDGAALITDGPYAETKEQLAGTTSWTARTWMKPLDWAAKIPTACAGAADVSRSGPFANSSACARECMTTAPPSNRSFATSRGASSPGSFASPLFDLAEEAMQDAFAAAVLNWQAEGVPDNPAAWITAAARRKLVDYARRDRRRRSNEEQILYQYESRSCTIDEEMSRPFEDDRLSLIFTCCHPAINKQAQVALTLRTWWTHHRRDCPRLVCFPSRLWRSGWSVPSARSSRPVSPIKCPTRAPYPNGLSAVQAVLYPRL